MPAASPPAMAFPSVVRRALQRAGIQAPCQGAHLLRHTAATEMLRHGVPLDQIGLVLRHRSIDMTAYYAKVDVALLHRSLSRGRRWSMIDGGRGPIWPCGVPPALPSATRPICCAALPACGRSPGTAYPHGDGHGLGQPSGSVAQRHTRYQTVCRLLFRPLEDPRHELPPGEYFGYRKTRRVPHIYSR